MSESELSSSDGTATTPLATDIDVVHPVMTDCPGTTGSVSMVLGPLNKLCVECDHRAVGALAR